MMGERERLCAVCNTPSPGPAKRLYYQYRNYGPFFPILEEQRTKANSYLFIAGRAVVCTGCGNHLLRQWSAYDQKWTPLEKRTYTLLSEEREANRAKKASISSELTQPSGERSMRTTPRRQPFKQAVRKVGSQNKLLNVFSTENLGDRSPSSTQKSPSSTQTFSPSFITETDMGPFRRAVKKVSKQNTRALHESSKISDVFEAVIKEQRLKNEQKAERKPSHEIVSVVSSGTPRIKSSALWSLPSEEIRSKVREELQENIEVMIRKLAEIQHLENMRRYEQELQEAAHRICRAQDREGDIDHMCRNLKKQLREELMFRDTSRVLRDNNEENIIPSSNGEVRPREPEPMGVGFESKAGLESITVAKKVGTEWKARAKKERSKRKSFDASQRRKVPLRSLSDTISRDVKKEEQQPPRSAHNLDAVLRELEQEKEWRIKTENTILRQREMIEDLRKGIQDDVKCLIDEQNKRYQDLKETIVAYERAKPGPSPSRNNHQPLVESRPTLDKLKNSRERKDQLPLRSDTWLHDEVPSEVIHNEHDNDGSDHSDDRTDDSDDEDDLSPPHTPEFYIH